MKHVKTMTGVSVSEQDDRCPTSAQKAPLSLISTANAMIAFGSLLLGVDLLKAAP